MSQTSILQIVTWLLQRYQITLLAVSLSRRILGCGTEHGQNEVHALLSKFKEPRCMH